MSYKPTFRSDHKATPTDPLSRPREVKVESSVTSYDLRNLAPRPSREPEKKEKVGGDTARSEVVERLRREVGYLEGQVERQAVDISRLRGERDFLRGRCKRRDDRIAELKRDISKMRVSSREAAEAHARQVQEMRERSKQKEELLEARSAELSGAQAFLSTADRLSEMEVVDIVRDLNEHIYQVAVSLTEGWEKLEPPRRATGRMKPNLTSQTRVPVLVQLARKRDFTALTFLLQSCLCSLVVSMTSRWGHYRELEALRHVYQNVSASGEHHIIDAR